MRIKNVTDYLETIAPLSLQESYDNSGLIVGDAAQEITQVLVCLDATEAVIDEAIRKGCNLVIAHHPIVFSGLKKLNGKNYVERVVIKAIRNDIAIYALHTNLDNVLYNGVNQKIAEKLGVSSLQVLKPLKQRLCKLVTFCPVAYAEAVRNALFAAGAGHIGNYDSCSFNVPGEGTFLANSAATPFVGEKEQLHRENETRIEMVFPDHLQQQLVACLKATHPYEEVAYDIYRLENEHPVAGAGVIGELATEMPVAAFLQHLKTSLQLSCIRYTSTHKTSIRRVAICGGAGSFLLKDAIAAGADVFVTADFKYHEFFDAGQQLMIADTGHYESEFYTIELIAEILTKKFHTFAVIFSEIITNPVKYYC